jgi:hypothetical protein
VNAKFSKRCEHDDAVVTVTAGIARTVCAHCGYMTIEFDHLTCRSWPDERDLAVSEIDAGQLRVSGR